MPGTGLFGLPVIPDADAIEAQATLVGSAGQTAATSGTDSHAEWQGLGAVYSAPEADQALRAFDRVTELTAEAGTVTGLIEAALKEYAVECRALKSRADGLISADGKCLPSDPDSDEDDAAQAAERAELNRQAALVRADFTAAQERCAAAIRAAAGLAPVPGPLSGDVFLGSLLFVNNTAARVHQPSILVRRTGTLEVGPPRPRVEVTYRGVEYARSPGGLLVNADVLEQMNRPAPRLEDYGRQRPELRADPKAVTPPSWAKGVGKGLFVVDAGITYWDEGSKQYNQDLVDHPEWNDEQRMKSAATNAAVVGTAGVAGGAAGAWGGAKIGMGIGAVAGNLIPIPGVGAAAGAVVGGIAGAVVGGIVGSKAGKWLGREAKDIWNSIWS